MRPGLARFVAKCLEGGVDIVQLRDKDLSDAETLRAAAVLAPLCAEHGVPLVVNDRPDLAAQAGADGVHVGQDDVAPELARDLVGEGALVGLSTHSPGELDEAIARGAPVDYVSAGPVVPTPTKPGRRGTGLDYVVDATRRAPWPVWITGGVTPERVPDLVAAGARHFVAVRWLTEADDPRAHARALRRAIDEAVAATGEADRPGAS
jgi:thiamine-phosphate pyrophosphorylase